MKKALMIAAIVMVAATAAFASGAGEADDTALPYGGGRAFVDQDRHEGLPWQPEPEAVELTGTFDGEDEEGYITLTTNGDVYTLAAPGGQVYADQISDGTEIGVAGTLLAAPSDYDGDYVGHVFVDTVTLNGETFDIGPVGYGAAGRGRFTDDDRFAGDDEWARGPMTTSRGRAPRGGSAPRGRF